MTSLEILHLAPRIICIVAILFISMFALDAFQDGLTVWQQIGAFLMHLIPSFVLTALLLIAWKWELIGGVIFTLIGLVFTPIVYTHNFNMNHSVWMSLSIVMFITLPFVIVGVLFIINHYKKRQTQGS